MERLVPPPRGGRHTHECTHAELDATTSGAVFSDAKRLLQNSYADSDGDGDQDADEPSYREDDMINISYRNVLWWTWFMDRYRTAGESDPTLGWDALVDLYDRLAALPVVEGDDGMTNALDIVTELDNSIRDRGSDFYTDYRDYTDHRSPVRVGHSDADSDPHLERIWRPPPSWVLVLPPVTWTWLARPWSWRPARGWCSSPGAGSTCWTACPALPAGRIRRRGRANLWPPRGG